MDESLYQEILDSDENGMKQYVITLIWRLVREGWMALFDFFYAYQFACCPFNVEYSKLYCKGINGRELRPSRRQEDPAWAEWESSKGLEWRHRSIWE